MPAKSPRKTGRGRKKATAALSERGFSEILAGVGNDWAISGLQIDAEVFQHVFSMRAAMRDAWLTNPYLVKYREQLAANAFGSDGIMLRSKVKETEDRVVHSPDEKWALIAHEQRMQRLRDWAASQTGKSIPAYRAYKLSDRLERSAPDDIQRGTAMIQVGAPDVYANQRIEAWWSEWQKAKYCDVRQRRTYNMLRQIRLWGAARDGEHWIRLVKDPRVNEMGFAVQTINAEWVDDFYNTTLENGNVIRRGVEYPFTPWGIGAPVAYHFIERIPRDWQTAARYSGNNSYAARTRVPADQIIHYARFTDTESTRPAPWGMAVLGKIRHLDQAEVAEVVSSRVEACKTGWLYSDLVPEGGMPSQIDPRSGLPTQQVTPGGMYALPWGVKYQANNPTHPNGNFPAFRRSQGQASCAGLPGADYNVIFNDLENINFSAGRLGRLDTNEISKMLQQFDIDTAERPIFEAGLEMALITGTLPFSFSASKFTKLNKPVFQGRRWAQVDEGKAVTAAALRVANLFSSRNKECAEAGIDFEENLFEIAEEQMLCDQLGVNPATTAHDSTSAPPVDGADEEDPAKPADVADNEP